MSKLLTLDFWFNVRPEPIPTIYLKAIGVILALLFIYMIASKIIVKKKKGAPYNYLLRKLNPFIATNIVFGLFFLFFHYERTPFFSSKFWIILWLIEIGIWLYFIIKAARALPEKKKRLEEKKQFEKYIP